MTESVRTTTPRSTNTPDRGAHRPAYPADVLLIADEPPRPGRGRAGSLIKGGITSKADASIEPLDMESVVRKLIALLSEETQS